MSIDIFSKHSLALLQHNEESNDVLKKTITKDEVIKAIKSVKNNKSPGDDLIINEYICSTVDLLCDVYVYLFNLILPEAWLIGNVIQVFKNKGSKSEPKNYRPITLLSCLGKIFISI